MKDLYHRKQGQIRARRDSNPRQTWYRKPIAEIITILTTKALRTLISVNDPYYFGHETGM